ncbi:MAG: hypothetical protein K0R18_559 [Bacillales bacterium]|jgi:transcription elongation factor Elf1|nr:hypothetical protein [Bacillales bacterium]
MNQLTCDNCEKEFELQLESKVVERDIHLAFFSCPHCHHEFKSYYTDAKIRARQGKIQELFAKIMTNPNVSKLQKLIDRKDELVRYNKLEMDNLRTKLDN